MNHIPADDGTDIPRRDVGGHPPSPEPDDDPRPAAEPAEPDRARPPRWVPRDEAIAGDYHRDDPV